MTLLLHLNLQNTRLEDLVEHIRFYLESGILLMEHTDDTLMGVANPSQPYNWYFEQSGSDPVIVASEIQKSTVRYMFQVRYIHNFKRQELLLLEIERYQSNDLHILLRLYLNDADPTRDTSTYASNALSDWLSSRWGNAVQEIGASQDLSKPEEIELVVQDLQARPTYEQPPLLGVRAKPEEWFAWFDWYYSQVWGPVPNTAEHMASLNGKSLSQNEKMHSLYMSGKRY